MTKYTKNILKEKLKSGKKVFGTWSIIGDTTSLNTIASSGIDFIVIDLEHGLIDYNKLSDMIRAIESENCSAVIRLQNKNEDHILKVLEAGAKSILVPHVSSIQEVNSIKSACKYYPDGHRGLSPYTCVHKYSHEDLDFSTVNDEILLGIMLEGLDCIDIARKIAGKVDMIYIGVYDISQVMGYPGDLYNKEVLRMVEKSKNLVKPSWIGSFARDEEYLELLNQFDYDFISYLVDCAVIKNSYKELREYFEELND